MKSEIQELIELCKNQGLDPSTLQQDIENLIAENYATWTHQEQLPQSTSILVDLEKGLFRIVENGNDHTPPDFAEHVEKNIRKMLIGQIRQNFVKQPQPSQPINTQPRLITPKPKTQSNGFELLMSIIFWFYNGSYLLFVILTLFTLLSSRGQFFFTSLLTAEPLQIIFTCLVLITPLISMLLVLGKPLQKLSYKTAKVLFLFEIPIVILAIIAANISQQTIPFVLFLLIVPITIPIVWILSLMPNSQSTEKNIYYNIALFIFTTIILCTSAYLSVLLSFFIPLWTGFLIVYLGGMILSAMQYGQLLELFIMLIPATIMLLFYGIGFAGFATVVLLPFYGVWYSLKSLRRQASSLMPILGRRQVRLILLGTIIIFVVIAESANISPPSPSLLSDLEAYKNANSYQQRLAIVQKLAGKKEDLRKELANPSVEYQKYPFRKVDNTVGSLYSQTFNLPDTLTDSLESVFDIISYPISYQGMIPGYSGYGLFQLFFEIYGEEYNSPYFKHGYQPKPVANVSVISRTATANSVLDSRFATVTIEESYKNKLYSNQEVVYEFTLPQYSVITDLKLGNKLEFQGIIAPRGAAERVFNQEVNRGRDPALLEQIGTSQYRLRVFPIPPLSTDQGTLKVSYSYLTPLTENGYALPSYTKKQNVDDQELGFLLRWDNSQPSFANDYIKANTAEICGSSTNNELVKTTQYTLLAMPCGNQQTLKPLTVAYDVSYNRSNTNLPWGEVKNWLSQNRAIYQDIDIYFINEFISNRYSYEQAMAIEQPLHFGQSLAPSQLSELQKNAQNLVLITSRNDVLLYQSLIDTAAKNTKVSVVTTSSLPVLSQQYVVKLLQKDILLTTKLSDLKTQAVTNPLAQGYGWQLQPSANPQIKTIIDSPEAKELNALGTHATITKNIINYGSSVLQTGYIDTLHKQAQQADIVTIYSSMIALVNQQQLQDLQTQSQHWNAYIAETPSASSQMPNRPIELPRSAPFGFNSAPSVPLFDSFIGASPSNESVGDIAAPQSSYGISTMSSAVNGLLSLFILLNLGLVGLGAVVYLIKKYKNRHNAQKL